MISGHHCHHCHHQYRLEPMWHSFVKRLSTWTQRGVPHKLQGVTNDGHLVISHHIVILIWSSLSLSSLLSSFGSYTNYTVRKVTISGKNLIYHLLNKNFRKYVKLLLNKKRVNETLNLLLPSQTPTSNPYSFRWHITVSVPEIKISLWDKTMFSRK